MIAPETRQSLLLRLRASDDQRAWEQFVEIYTPLVYQFCRGRGLQEADAADIGQEVLRVVARRIHEFDYEPQRGSFRSWLYAIARNKIRTYFEAEARKPVGVGQTTLASLSDERREESDWESQWEAEHQRCLFRWACDQARGAFSEQTWRAFWEVAVETRDAQEVARSLGMKLGALYVAKSRVVAKLRELVRAIEGQEAALENLAP